MAETQASRSVPPRLSTGIFFTSFAVLLLEIALTRIFSFTIWYHFAYLTISVALLGFGAAGSILASFPSLLDDPSKLLRRSCLAAAAGVALVLLVVSQVPLDPIAVLRERREFVNLLVYYVTVTVPFLAAGLAVAGVLATAPERVARLYFWDLVGAGLACLSVVPFIWQFGTPVVVAFSAVAFCVAAVLFTPAPSGRLIGAAIVLGTVALVVSAAVTINPARTKWISAHLGSGGRLIFSRWTPINRVDAVAWGDTQKTESTYRIHGASSRVKYTEPGMKFRMIGYDGDSCAVMYNFSGDRKEIDFLQHHILKLPYLLHRHPEVLIIGVGGGADILNAIGNDAKRIVGVELNPVTVELDEVAYRQYNGDIFNRPDVTLVAAEGRHYLRSRPDKYDVIEINGVDTLSALSSGAYVLSESYLYTADAVSDYLDHLKPGGIFAMAMGDIDTPQLPARHTLRLASNVRKALTERGVADPGRHVAVIASRQNILLAHTLVKNEPFTDEEIARLGGYVWDEGFAYLHRPNEPTPHAASTILRGDDGAREAFYQDQDLNLRATTDDSPFFFNFYKWARLPKRAQELDAARTLATGQIVLVIMLVQAIVFAILLIFAPLLRVRGHLQAVPRRIGYLLYFVALGLGFIFLEISFIQRFVLYLGYPTYALSVVLFSMLTFTGIGSFLSGRLSAPLAQVFATLLVALAAIVVLFLFGLTPIFNATLGASLAVRIAISVTLLAPLGIVLGMFFPLGITIVTRIDRQLVPWAWASNGCATVVGTILAVILAITWDFRHVTLAALAIYVAGVGAMLWAQAGRSTATR